MLSSPGEGGKFIGCDSLAKLAKQGVLAKQVAKQGVAKQGVQECDPQHH